jgi:hypothetical protein
MKPKLGLFRVLFVVLLLRASAWSAPTLVTVSGRQLLVDGTPFTVKGVNYSPTPVGSSVAGASGGCTGPYQWWTDQAIYNADFPLIKRMGANTIRAYAILNDTSPTAVLQVRAMLDAAEANGLYVIMNFYPSHFVDPTVPATQAAWQADFVAGINAYEDHAAVLIWEFANENNLDNGQNAGWYPLVQTILTAGKAADANHPMMTVEGETDVIDYTIGSVPRSANDASMTSLDIWGVNAYRGPTFQGVFEELELVTAKPLLLTEFGKDAFHDGSAQENQSIQAGHLQAQWGEIASRLSADNATEPLAGAVIFEWTDEWWKDGGANSCLTHSSTILFTRPLDTADPGYNDEWFGLAAVSPINAITNPAGTARTLRSGYSTMQSFWNPSAALAAAGSNSFFSDTVRNFPNPFRLGTDFTKFVIQANVQGSVSLRIFDAAGQFVTSYRVGVTPPARTEVFWDGKNGQGEQVSSGLYVVKIEGEGSGRQETQFRKVVGVK